MIAIVACNDKFCFQPLFRHFSSVLILFIWIKSALNYKLCFWIQARVINWVTYNTCRCQWKYFCKNKVAQIDTSHNYTNSVWCICKEYILSKNQITLTKNAIELDVTISKTMVFYYTYYKTTKKQLNQNTRYTNCYFWWKQRNNKIRKTHSQNSTNIPKNINYCQQFHFFFLGSWTIMDTKSKIQYYKNCIKLYIHESRVIQ